MPGVFDGCRRRAAGIDTVAGFAGNRARDERVAFGEPTRFDEEVEAGGAFSPYRQIGCDDGGRNDVHIQHVVEGVGPSRAIGVLPTLEGSQGSRLSWLDALDTGEATHLPGERVDLLHPTFASESEVVTVQE